MLFRILLYSSLNVPCIFRVLTAVKALYCFELANLKNLGAGLFFYSSASAYLHNFQKVANNSALAALLFDSGKARVCVEVPVNSKVSSPAAGGHTGKWIPLQFVTV